MGFGFGLGFGNKSGSVIYDPDAQALFDKWDELGAPAPTSFKTMWNNVITHLKLIDYWDELDTLPVYIAHARIAGLVDPRRPSVSQVVSGAYSGDFTTYGGFNGSSANSFRMASAYNPGDGGTYKFTQNSNSFGFYAIDHVNENGVDVSGIVGTTGIEMLSNVTTFSPSHKNNNGTFRSAPNVTNVGLFSSRRTASNAWSVFRNGYTLQDASNLAPTDASSSVQNIEWTYWCRNISGVFSVYSNKPIAYRFAGSGLIDPFVLHNILDKYLLNPLGVTPTKRIMFNGNSMTQTSTYVNRILDSVGRNNFDIMKRGLNANTTPQLTADGLVNVFPKQKDFLEKEVFFFAELTNHFNSNSSNIAATYNALVDELVLAKAAFPNRALIITTCLPRAESATFINALRQNDADLYDESTLNGYVRNHIVQDGYATAISDWGADPVMGIYSNGVAGVGEKNTDYFGVDELHPNTAGYNKLSDDWNIPAITPYI